MGAERVQKLLAAAGVASRRAGEELIREGRVTVNGKIVGLGDRADPAVDSIKVDGKRVRPLPEHRHILLNKPAGYITTRRDPEGRPSVFDLIPGRLRRALKAVGRLDFQTEGLLLLTTDGDLANRVAHPRYGCLKTYEVKVKGRPSDEQLERFRRGLVIDGVRTRPAEISAHAVAGRRKGKDSTWWTVRLGEGRTRQIREMFFRIGHPVMRLRRVAIGSVQDKGLRPGDSRELTEQEVHSLRQGGGGPPRAGRKRRRRRAPKRRPGSGS